jgi:hypothetical protein
MEARQEGIHKPSVKYGEGLTKAYAKYDAGDTGVYTINKGKILHESSCLWKRKIINLSSGNKIINHL